MKLVPEKGILDELETLGCQGIGRSLVDDGRVCPFPIAHVGSLDKGLDEARAKGWTVVDMKADWKVVYPFERK